MSHSMPGLPVPHQLLEFTQTHVHWVGDAMQSSSSVVPFSSCPQSFPASGSFPMSQFFALGDQSIGVSASTSVLPVNTQDWSPLGWTSWISLQSKGLSRVFSNTTVQKHQFFGVQLSLQTTTWYKHNFYMYWETKRSLFAVLWWSGTEATVSLRHACTETNCQINDEDKKIPTSKGFMRIKWACTERNRKCFNTVFST